MFLPCNRSTALTGLKLRGDELSCVLVSQSPGSSVPSSAADGVAARDPATAATSTVRPAAPDLKPANAWSVSAVSIVSH